MSATETMRRAADLPQELTRFIGREQELAELLASLDAHRLVTLLGVGGVGKSRLALRAARERRHRYPDGVCMIELSALRDAELIAHAVAAAIDLPESEQSASSRLDAVLGYLEARNFLLVLDTCEHLVDACALFCEIVLQRCPQVTVVATTRQPLDVPGEHVVPVAPFTVPEPDDPAAADSPAVQLFAERARAVLPSFAIDEANRDLVVRLCARLDGIPLAIELAVVRLRALPLRQILDRLDHRYRVLTGASRTGLERHQTLRMAISWSHDLCSPPEQLLWARLSVFAGEFDLSAAEAVCAGEALPAEEILDHLIGLVDKTVVLRIDDGDDGARYRMLDTIREFGRERLEGLGGEQALRARHRDHFRGLAAVFEQEWLGDGQVAWVKRLWRERADLRGALEFCIGAEGEAETGAALATDLWGFWLASGQLDEGRYWLERFLDRYDEPTPTRMWALEAAGHLSGLSGNTPLAFELTARSRELAMSLGDRAALGYLSMNEGLFHCFTGAIDRALPLYDEARALLEEVGARRGTAMLLMVIGGTLTTLGRPVEALPVCEEAIAQLDAPKECWVQGWVYWEKGCALWLTGQPSAAREVLREALTRCQATNHAQGLAYSFDTLAWIAAAGGSGREAARLLGMADTAWERFFQPRLGIPAMHAAHAEAERQAESLLGEVEFGRQYRAGRSLPLEDAVREGVCGEDPAGAGGSASASASASAAGAWAEPSWRALTRREQQVGALVCEGLSNRDIALKLVISKRTVDAHVEHILEKLDVSSRTEIAAFRSGL
jgi:non-specific serine/threonine protein kinase